MAILASNMQVTYSGMGTVLALRNAGYLIGNLFGAVLQTIVKNHSEGLLFVAFILPAIVMFATPHVTSLIIMCILSFIHGLSKAFTDLGGNNLLLQMWGIHAAAPLNAVHLGYGLGAIFINLLVRPFITKKASSSDNPNIIIPYSVAAGLCFLISLGHLIFYIVKVTHRRQKVQVQEQQEVDYTAANTNPVNIVNHSIDIKNYSPYSPRTCGRGDFQYGLILSMIFIIYTFSIGGSSQTFSKFFFSYLQSDQFNLSTENASWGMILFWFSFSVGRLIFATVSVYVSVNKCLNIIWFGALCLSIAWLIFVWVIGLTFASLLVLGAITGLIFSPMFPLSFAFFNQRLNVIPMLLALLLSGTASGAMTLNKIAGSVMDYNPKHFPTLLAVCILMAVILYIISHLVYYFHQRNRVHNDQIHSPQCFNEEEEN
ncbi:hypothetical protein I4U23_011003 [Adineta vaga]|nr:hypothetical protein I4U23_011003 [Adineta vaga]